MGIFKVTRETKIVLTGVFLICVAGFTAAYLYYSGINRSEDPRTMDARFLFVRYDELIKDKNHHKALLVLDTIEGILKNTPGYPDSYEMGMVWNNRGTVCISKALYQVDDSLMKTYLLDSALMYVRRGIEVYNIWLDRYGGLTAEEISERVELFFKPDDVAFRGLPYQKIVQKRVKDILSAQTETPRRLSVAYTNLGIIQRHQRQFTDAIESYRKALELWKDNPAAEGNLNVLYGKPYKERSIIKKLFPPSRTK